MSDKVSSSSSSGIGFVGLLTIVLITLKLLGKIAWSWWWVISPIWISIIVGVVCVAVVFGGIGALALGTAIWEKHDEKKRFARTTARREQLAASRAKSIETARAKSEQARRIS